MKLTVNLTNGEKINILENTVLVGYIYEEDPKTRYQKQRAEEFTLIMLTPNWNSLVEFLSVSYCFEVKNNGNRGKIYFSQSVCSILYNDEIVC